MERLDKYLSVTKRAMDKVKFITTNEQKAKEFFDMAQRYYNDAFYFKEQQREIDAFAAVNYAHGWLDAGARAGFFDVGRDNKLFTVD